MKKFGLPACPYCGKKVNFIKAWKIKKQGEYRCPQCGGYSNILLAPFVPLSAIAAVVLAIILYIIFYFTIGITVPIIFCILAPFVLFFVFSCFFIQLKKPVFRKTGPAPQSGGPSAPPVAPAPGGYPESREDMEKTRIL